MHFGEILVARGLVSVANMAKAQERHRQAGGRLPDILVEMRLLSPPALMAAQEQVVATAPLQPRSLADTGVSVANLLGLMLRFMALDSRETAAEIMHAMKLPYGIVEKLLDEARGRSWIQAMGIGLTGQAAEPRYTLSKEGRNALADAMAQPQYLGPAPVPLEVFQAVRDAVRIPVGVRVSATDWVDHGWDLEQTVAFAQALKARGCDFMDVSSGGISPAQQIPLGPGYQVHLAARVRAAPGIPPSRAASARSRRGSTPAARTAANRARCVACPKPAW